MDNQNQLELSNNSNSDYTSTVVIIIIIVTLFVYLVWNNNEKFTQTSNKSNEIINNLKKYNNNLKKSIKYGNLLLDNDHTKQFEQQTYELITNQSDSNLSIHSENNYDIEDKITQNLKNENHTKNMDEFTKNNYALYAHQITCPNKCNLKEDGSCNHLDTTLMNNIAFKNNANKDCVMCTRGQHNLDNIHLSDSIASEDIQRIEKKKVTFNNMDKFTNFQNEVYQNSIGETPVDKMAEIRTCNTGTCGLKSFGKSINDVYNNLTNTISYNDRYNNNTSRPIGILENHSNTNFYEQL